MRKVTLVVVGIAGLSLLLCGSDEVLAQTKGQATGGEGASTVELRQSVLARERSTVRE